MAGRIPEAREAIKAAYGSWKAKAELLVFRAFIERDRNNILKQYQMNVLDSSEVAVVVVGWGHFAPFRLLQSRQSA